jgi:uncharacterized protein GlcG (DUF336 family)
MRLLVAMIMLLMSLAALAEDEAFVTTRVLTASTANQIAVAAEAYCRKKGYQVSVAVVDRYGNLLSFIRDPLSGAHTIGVAIDKAYTAASFQGATIELANQLEFLKGTPRVSLVGGGVPVRVGGYIYGAVGISGAPRQKIPGDVDDECARAGIDAVKDALEFAG